MAQKKLQKVAYKTEPKLHVHRYVVAIHRKVGKMWKTGFWYCSSLKDVKSRCEKVPKGAIIEVFSAVHNFVQAYEKVS